MKKLVLIIMLFSFSCENDDINECINLEKVSKTTGCPYNLNAVCGCNSITYDNECFAKAAGVVRWTKGECK